MKPLNAVPLTIVPIGVEAAKKYVARWHRHNSAPLRGMFAVAVADADGRLRGVGIATQPTARALMDLLTCEANRVCTDGAPNACSMLYGSLARAAKALGYHRIITYIRASEPGTSLRAAGFVPDGEPVVNDWHRKRGRVHFDLLGARRDFGPRVRWVRWLAESA